MKKKEKVCDRCGYIHPRTNNNNNNNNNNSSSSSSSFNKSKSNDLLTNIESSSTNEYSDKLSMNVESSSSSSSSSTEGNVVSELMTSSSFSSIEGNVVSELMTSSSSSTKGNVADLDSIRKLAGLDQVPDRERKRRKVEYLKRKALKRLDETVHIRLFGIVDFDGRHFHGFQRQVDSFGWCIPTVQTIMEECIAKTLTMVDEDVRFIGKQTCSLNVKTCEGPKMGQPTPITVCTGCRTDTGVHASGQIFHVDVPKSIYEEGGTQQQFVENVNKRLGKDHVHIKKLQVVPIVTEYHSQHLPCGKRYRYVLYDSTTSAPLEGERGRFYDYYGKIRKWRKPEQLLQLDVKKMNRAIGLIADGKEKDFRLFTRSMNRICKQTERKTRRTIWKAKVVRSGSWKCEDGNENGSFIHFVIEGSGFLFLMVRCLMNALVDIGKGSIENENYILEKTTTLPREEEILKSKKLVVQPFSPDGLNLEYVYINNPIIFEGEYKPPN